MSPLSNLYAIATLVLSTGIVSADFRNEFKVGTVTLNDIILFRMDADVK